jgi:hypothetical protein
MLSRALVVVALSAVAPTLTLIAACNATGLGPKPPITSAMLDAGPDGSGGASAPDAESTAIFFACATDSDCVPVPKNSCCDDGFMEAVNPKYADAYKASFTCSTKKVCPLFRINDTRKARCAPDTHKCELDRPEGARELPTPH